MMVGETGKKYEGFFEAMELPVETSLDEDRIYIANAALEMLAETDHEVIAQKLKWQMRILVGFNDKWLVAWGGTSLRPKE